ncbi:MAG: serine/threonine protein kinase [Bacteroidetes bacterium]|nr:serine/threonine protein kinase [Bacteroidota bacterium]
MNLLNTNNGSYLFDPGNDNLVLKRNGKFSSVYIGYQLPEKNKVVIKVMNPALNNDAPSIIRFHKEALKSFEHPDLQKTIDAYNDETGYYLIKEYIDGQTLSQIVYQQRITDIDFYCRVFIKVLKIIEVLNDKEIFHCDIRLENILLLNKQGSNETDFDSLQVVLLDLGLAKIPETFNKRELQPFSFVYSPPEQVLNYGELINKTTDQYSVAICMYECITATKPFMNENPEVVMHLQLNTKLLPHKNIPEPLFKVLLHATEKEKLPLPPSQLSEEQLINYLKSGQQKRYESATAFKHAILNAMDEMEKQKSTNNTKGFWAKLFGK